ncbi:MAG: DUF4258 domain-containing protein [Chloroflexota bacterium]
MEIEFIRKRVLAGKYLVKGHALQHALKEGFERPHIIQAILNGTIIEAYPDEQRVLVCGRITVASVGLVYLHVICEYADANYVEIVTAYVPDKRLWEEPPYRRRRGRKKR